MTKLFLNLILAWPVLALILHLLITKLNHSLRRMVQSGLIFFWLGFNMMLLFTDSQPLVIMQGSWPTPFGIALVVDQLSKVMLMTFSIVVTCINFYSYQDQAIIEKQQIFYAGFWLLLLGISGSILTGDIFNLYVWFEVMLTSAFILLVSTNKPKPGVILHYAVMNILGTLFMLLAVALLYGALGTLNYAAIAEQLSFSDHQWLLPILSLMLFAMGLKGAIFPLYFWLPTAYPPPRMSSTLLLSSLITKVVMVVLLRLAWLWPPLHEIFLSRILFWISLASMFFGVIGAASQFRFKDILAFHVISQLGYVLLAIVLPVPIAIVAAVYFLIHNIFVKTNLFMVAGVLEQHIRTDHLKKLGQVLKQHKWVATVFFLAALSLAGIPPLSGFWAKFFVIKAALVSHVYLGAAIALIVSLFTLYSMIKIWHYVFCEPPTIECNSPPKPLKFSWNLTFALVPLLVLPIIMGLFPDSFLYFLQPVANQLQQPEHYIRLVLGTSV